MENLARVWALISLLILTSLASAQMTPDQFAYQGQIIRPDGTALEGNNVDFFIEILSPTDDCVLYREHHSLNMEGSNGIFSLRVGDGAPHGGGPAASTPLSQALSNSSGPFLGYDCDGGPGDYTPTSTDRRKLRLTFNDGSGNNTIAHDHELLSAPYAFSAQTLEGYTPGDFVRINDESPNALSQANIETVFTDSNYAELLALLDGSSASFTVGTITSNLNLYNNRIVNLDDPVDANDATNKNYVDTNIGGLEVDAALGSIGAGEMGQVLTWSGTQWQTQTVVDPTKLPLDGGTMTGAIVMGGNDITGVQNLGVNNDATVSNDLSVGNDLSVDENVLVGGGIGVATGINSDGNVSIYQQQALQLTPETSTGSNNYVGFRAPAALSDTQIWTLPGEDGQAGQVMRTDGSGNLDWITVTMDGASFLAEDGTAVEPSIAFEDNTNTGLYRPGADSLAITTGGSERLRVMDNGWVGIGTTTPETLLDVAGGVRIGEETQPCVGALAGTLQYDPLEDEVQFCDGVAWTGLGTSSTEGTVTSITAGAGLDGGTITDNGTIDVATGGIIESMLATNSVSSDKIQNNAVTTGKILNGAVTDDKLATDSVTSDKIAAGAVGSAEIATGAVGSAQIAENAVTGVELADNAVDSQHIAANAVTASELADDAVGTDQIANGSVTDAKIVGVDGSKVTGNIGGNAAGFTGVLAGDVTGEQGSTVVGAIQGRAVAAAAPSDGQVLLWNNTEDQWEATSLPEGADAWTVDGSDIYRDTGNVGIGLATPATRLDVAGAVRVGADGALACGAPTAGALRYEGGNVEFCNGTTWAAFGTSSSTGTVTEILTGTGLTGGPITDNGTISIAAGGVSATELASDAVTSDKIAAGAVGSAEIATGAVGSAQIAEDAVTGVELADNAVDSQHIAANAVTASELANDAVGTDQIADGSVTDAKIDSVDGSKVTGNIGGNAAGFTGVLAGDVTGEQGSTVVGAIQGRAVAAAAPSDGQVLLWNNTEDQWEATSLPEGADAWVVDGTDIYRDTGNVGIGLATPATRLDVAGAVRVGEDVALACGAPTAGALRYEGGNVEFCNGTTWAAFGTSSSTGTVTEILTGTGLTGGPITDNGTISIAAGGVSATELASDAVTTDKILNGAVTDVKIAAGAVGSAQIAENAVTGVELADNAVDSQHIATNAVTASELANDAVGTDQIADGSVTDAKIVGVDGSKVTGNIGGNAAGFTGVLSGDVTGEQGSTVVGAIQGRAVAAAAPSDGQVLLWNNTEDQWEATSLPAGADAWVVDGADIYRDTGNVGIGTATPQRTLDVAGVLRLGPSALPGTPAAGDVAIDSGESNKLKFYDGSDWVTVADANESLSFPLLADSLGSAAAPVYSFDGDSNTGVYASGANSLSFSTDGNERVRINNAGLGVGVADPQRVFHISGPMRIQPTALPTGAAGDIAVNSTGNVLNYHNGTDWVPLITASSALDDLSDVSASAPTSGHVLTWNGANWAPAAVPDPLSFPLLADPVGTAGAPAYSFNGSATTGMYSPGANIVAFSTGGTERMRLHADGSVGIGAVATPEEQLEVEGKVKAESFVSDSDERLKDNMIPVPGLESVQQLTGYTYNWKKNGKKDMGVSAQEVERLFPHAVVTNSKTGFKAVQYQALIAPLIEASKELAVMCEANEEWLEGLKEQVDDHERRIASLEAEKAELAQLNKEQDDRLLKLEQENAMMKSFLCQQNPSADFCN